MNIPPEVARSQGHHGVKGAVHGIKGGRPRLALTAEERKEHRRKQQEAWRRRNGIPPREVLTWEERQDRRAKLRAERLDKEYCRVWRKSPGEPFTPKEFAEGQNRYKKWVRACRDRNCPLAWPVDFVRAHYRAIQKQQRAEWLKSLEAEEYDEDEEEESLPDIVESKPRKRRTRNGWKAYVAEPPPMVMPSVGRNQPCPCGSGRKFKKCCCP